MLHVRIRANPREWEMEQGVGTQWREGGPGKVTRVGAPVEVGNGGLREQRFITRTCATDK